MSKEPKRNVYVGHRYVPKVMGEWDKTESYEGLSIVTNEGTSYTSKKRVPIGIDIKNEEYWVVTGNYNAQIEEYRKDVREMEKEVGKKSDQSYVDNLNEKVTTQLAQTTSDLLQRAVNVMQPPYNAKGNANYYNKNDGKWYADAEFTTLSTDDTIAIQAAIDELPLGGVITGVNASYLVGSLHLKSHMSIKDFNLVSKGGDTALQSPITIGKNGDKSLRENIHIRNIHIDGNRSNQTNLSSSEDGGRHGFRLIGSIDNVSIKDSSATNCATDGIELYKGLGTTDSETYDRGIKTNIRIENCKFNWNRRHGGSGECMSDVEFVRCEFKYNGLDVDGGMSEGAKGTGYGNGFDMEEYNVSDIVNGITFKNCELTKNGRAGLLFYAGIDVKANNPNFVKRSDIYIIECKIDNGNDYVAALEITPHGSNKSLGAYYQNVFITDCYIWGGISLRSVDTAFVSGGRVNTEGKRLGNLDYATNIHVGELIRDDKKFGVTASTVTYPSPEGFKSFNLYAPLNDKVRVLDLPNVRSALVVLSSDNPSRSALIFIGDNSGGSAHKLSGWDKVTTSSEILTGTTGPEGSINISFIDGKLYIENRFGYTVGHSVTILGV